MTLTIKRYPNRKLYDTAAKQYVTLEEIATLIRSGVEVVVRDHASGEDLTALTLSQIILEQEKKPGGFLPHHVLTGLVQSGGGRLSAVQRSLFSALGMARVVDEEIERRIKALVNDGELSAREASTLLKKLLAHSQPALPGEPPTEVVVEKVLNQRGVPDRSDLQRLLDQVESLSNRLDDMTLNQEPPADDDQS